MSNEHGKNGRYAYDRDANRVRYKYMLHERCTHKQLWHPAYRVSVKDKVTRTTDRLKTNKRVDTLFLRYIRAELMISVCQLACTNCGSLISPVDLCLTRTSPTQHVRVVEP